MEKKKKPFLSQYQIKVKGILDSRWASWFDEMTITVEDEPDNLTTTTLAGPVIDQAALHGILAKIRDLNLTLISVIPLSPSAKEKKIEG